jgi:SAM-dependent methyltransferase
MPARFLAALAALCIGFGVQAQTPPPLEPFVGQPGKDVVWVPTPQALVEKMLDMAQVTPSDYVIDLGSGDGRNIIAAAKRGAQALGVEYDSNLVAVSRRNATAQGVAANARFVEGDMYDADISKATVLALFLLPDNLDRLKSKFERLRPGSRIVTNGYQIPGWEAKEIGTAEGDCGHWCIAYLYIVPLTYANRAPATNRP